MAKMRTSTTFVPLADGRVLVVSGADERTASYELYDALSGTWTLAGTVDSFTAPSGVFIGVARTLMLSDGRLMAVGAGYNSGGWHSLPTVSVFDAQTGAWADGPSMITGRTAMGVALLRDGRVLVSGGSVTGNAPTALSEVLTP
jgi:hypothetical protein